MSNEFISIEVKNPEVECNSGISRRTGNAYDIRFQRAQLELPNGEIRNVELQHDDGATDKDALPVGRYRPKRSAVYLDAKKKLAISLRVHSWQPVEAVKPVLTAAK